MKKKILLIIAAVALVTLGTAVAAHNGAGSSVVMAEPGGN